MKFGTLVVVCALVLGCASGSANRVRLTPLPSLIAAAPSTVGMAGDIGTRLDSIVAVGIAQGAAPGVALAVGRWGRLIHLRAYGRIDTGTVAAAVTDSTLFDMASLTKVVATTTAAMILEDDGRLNMNATVHSYLPDLDRSEE